MVTITEEFAPRVSNYKIIALEIKEAKNQSEYLRLTLIDVEDDWSDPFVVPVWNEHQVARWKNLLASPEIMGDINKIPAERLMFNYGARRVKKLPQPMMRLWSQDIESKRADGTTEVHKAGTPILDKMGNPVLYDSIEVFYKLKKSAVTGALEEAEGWGFTERFNQIMARQYALPTTGSADVTIPEGVVTPQAPQAPVAPVVQQAPITPGVVQPGVVPQAGVTPVVQAPVV